MIHADAILPSPNNWDIFGARIFEIEQAVFGEDSLSAAMMATDINDPKTSLILLKDGDLIVGFSYAVPEGDEVARIVDTVIAKEYQGRGHISLIMSRLEDTLRRSGYRYITRDAMIGNGYADKIEKNYADRIVETKEIASQWGKQKHFKIKL